MRLTEPTLTPSQPSKGNNMTVEPVSYKALVEQRIALDAQIEALCKQEMSAAVTQARELVATYGLTEADVFPGGRKASSAKGSTVAPKYRNPATGETWTGRGKAPKWIRDEDRAKFAI